MDGNLYLSPQVYQRIILKWLHILVQLFYKDWQNMEYIKDKHKMESTKYDV